MRTRVADLTVAIGDAARVLPPRAQPARDRRPAAPPRSGLPRRARRRPAAGAGRGRARRRDRILRGTQLLAPAGDIIAAEWLPSPGASRRRPSVMSGQILKVASCVRRALRRRRRTAPVSRSKRCAPRRSTCTTRGCWPRSRWCSTGAGCSAISSAERRGRGHAAAAGHPAALEAEVDDAEPHHDVADRELLVREPRRGDHVTEEREQVVVLLRTVLHGLLDRHVHLAAVALAHVVLGRHALVQRDDEHVERDADRDDRHAAHRAVHEAEPEDRHVGGEQDREAEIARSGPSGTSRPRARSGWPGRRSSSHSSRKRRRLSRSKLPFVTTTTMTASAIVADEEDHAHTVPTVACACRRYPPRMYELRSSSEGTVIRVEVDEGQMVPRTTRSRCSTPNGSGRRRHRRPRGRARALRGGRLPGHAGQGHRAHRRVLTERAIVSVVRRQQPLEVRVGRRTARRGTGSRPRTTWSSAGGGGRAATSSETDRRARSSPQRIVGTRDDDSPDSPPIECGVLAVATFAGRRRRGHARRGAPAAPGRQTLGRRVLRVAGRERERGELVTGTRGIG